MKHTRVTRTRKRGKANTKIFELLVDGTPVEVCATPYEFNEETRFRVSYNGSPVLVFVWDESLSTLTAIGPETEILPDNIEQAIAHSLLRMAA